ncbi:hypothetical protein FB45DRAFT_930110 [Roridomyces roridus]|uniref:Uncharacterized protein n=1 Tax=Roridomyces roridus TaxID=1738132 RepID=A0AAD7FHG3_9AGAR|nr:hypothetical protein FB45DRAFT_930110 [Roridomyces roridus]
MQRTCPYWERKMPPTRVMRNWPIKGKPHAGAGEQPGSWIASITTLFLSKPPRERPCGERSLECIVLTRCTEQGCRGQPHSYGIGHHTGGTYTVTRRMKVDGRAGGKGRRRKEGKTAHLVCLAFQEQTVNTPHKSRRSQRLRGCEGATFD